MAEKLLYSARRDNDGEEDVSPINDRMVDGKKAARKEVQLILQKLSGAKGRMKRVLSQMYAKLELYQEDPPSPRPEDYELQQEYRLYGMKEGRERVAIIKDWVNQTEMYYLEQLAVADYDRYELETFEDAYEEHRNDLSEDYLALGRPVEQFLDKVELRAAAEQRHEAEQYRLREPEPAIFEGDPAQYRDFKAGFRLSVEKGMRPKEECMVHLRGRLVGPARSAISDVPNTTEGYDQAWRVLDGRFGDEQQRRQVLLKRLRELSGLAPEATVEELRKHHDGVQELYSSLRQVWPNIEEQKESMYPMVASSYPLGPLLIVDRNIKNFDIPGFLEGMETYLASEERCRALYQSAGPAGDDLTSEDQAKNKRGPQKRKSSQNQLPNPFDNSEAWKRAKGVWEEEIIARFGRGEGGEDRILVIGPPEESSADEEEDGLEAEELTSPTTQMRCQYCAQHHWLSECGLFRALTVAEREAQVRGRSLCLRCFSPEHYSKECCADITCTAKQGGNGKVCGMKHNTLLHRDDPQCMDGATRDDDGSHGRSPKLPDDGGRRVGRTTHATGVVRFDDGKRTARRSPAIAATVAREAGLTKESSEFAKTKKGGSKARPGPGPSGPRSPEMKIEAPPPYEEVVPSPAAETTATLLSDYVSQLPGFQVQLPGDELRTIIPRKDASTKKKRDSSNRTPNHSNTSSRIRAIGQALQHKSGKAQQGGRMVQ